MAAPASCIAVKSLLEDGFYDLQDPVAGERFQDMENRGRRFVTPYGIDFLKVIVLNPRIRRILKEFYDRVTLGHSLIYKQRPQRIYSFTRGGPGTFFIPAVHICSKGSEVEYWIGSQNHDLRTKNKDDEPETQNKPVEPVDALFEYAETKLIDAKCQRKKFVFNDGALVLIDARIAFTRTKNDLLMSVFFPDDRVPPPPMLLSTWSQEIEDKVEDLQSDEIGVNFQFGGL